MRIIYYSLFFFTLVLPLKSEAQHISIDLTLINNKDYVGLKKQLYYSGNPVDNNQNPLQPKRINIFTKYNPVSIIATGMMLFYQHVASPQFSRRCLYEITCSNFSKGAIHEFGLIKGVFLSADRILRCNFSALQEVPLDRFNKSGFIIDPPVNYHIH